MQRAKGNKQPELLALAQAVGGQSALARLTGLPPTKLGEVINLKCKPSLRQIETGSAWRELDALLLAHRGVGLGDIFWPETRPLQLSVVERDLARRAAPEGNQIENRELKEAFGRVLPTLTSREQRVVEMCFGLDGEGERTLEEVGQYFGVSPERIRQIRIKALRKMRHPSISKSLKPFLESPAVYHGRYHRKAIEEAEAARREAERERWAHERQRREWEREMSAVVARMDTSPVKPGHAFWCAKLGFDMSVYAGRMHSTPLWPRDGAPEATRYEFEMALHRGRIVGYRF